MSRIADFDRSPRLRLVGHFRLAISERRLLLAVGDICIIVASIAGATWLWEGRASSHFDQVIWREQILWALFIVGGWWLWLILGRLYDLRLAVQRYTLTRRILFGGVIIALAYIALFFVTSPQSTVQLLAGFQPMAVPMLPRFAPMVAIAGSTALLLTWRLSYALLLGGPHLRRRVLILGAGEAGSTACQAILDNHASHIHVIGFVDDHPTKQSARIHGRPVLGDHKRLLQLAKDNEADEIVVAISAEARGSLFQVIMDCYERGIAVTPMPILYERLTGKIPVEHIGSQWYVALPFQQHPANIVHRALKRVADIVLGLVGALILLVMLPFIALAIYLDSPGPIFYCQTRAGLHGRPFTAVKFRSMRTDAEGDGAPRWATKNDDRVTRLGKWLRKTRLDELPQLLNVVNGDMSLVGPRPERPEFVNQLQHQIPFYRTRLAAKPGLTGWAQVNYGYGASVEDALIKLQYDLYYVKHQSAWLDVLILLRTVGVVAGMKGQ